MKTIKERFEDVHELKKREINNLKQQIMILWLFSEFNRPAGEGGIFMWKNETFETLRGKNFK